MKNFLSRKNRNKNGKVGAEIDSPTYYLIDKEYGLYLEDYFNETLYLERKRSERSKKRFLLMLMDISELSELVELQEIITSARDVIFSLTRETDIKGWHRNGTVLGVIFTEINGVDKNYLAAKYREKLLEVINKKYVKKITISFHIFPEAKDKLTQDKSVDLALYPDLTKKTISQKASFVVKRTLDIIGGILGIILFSPFFIIVPILIKTTSKGPVFFRQERLGQFGKKFYFLKFRSMHVNNDSKIHQEYIKKFIKEQGSYDKGNGNGDKSAVFKIKNDPRVTPVGRFIRKTSLDELPQFFNVLKGEMSLVGPRPPIEYEMDNYALWHRRRVLEAKPGITGLWQVEGRSSTTFDEMVRLDIKYIREQSFLLDIKLLLKTPFVMFTGKGAY